MTRRGGEVFAVVTGGGTGGHVSPGLALAEALVRRGHPRETIRWIGGERGAEVRMVPRAGIRLEVLPGRGLARRWTWRNAVVLAQTAAATGRAWRLLRRWRPRVVVGTGGWASVPTVLAARGRRLPVVVHELDARPGLANRVAVRLGARAAVSVAGTPLRGAVWTGNPIRPELDAVTRAPVDPPLVAVVGGSLGAGSLNDAALDLYDRWRARDDVAVHHVCGPRNLEACTRRLADLRRPGDRLPYELVGYEDDVAGLYARAAVVVSRAGANAVAELLAAGVPAVLVPLPGAPGDHQRHNATAAARTGAAVVLPDAQCDAGRLDALLADLLADPARRASMSVAGRAAAVPGAAERLADLVEEVARAAS